MSQTNRISNLFKKKKNKSSRQRWFFSPWCWKS